MQKKRMSDQEITDLVNGKSFDELERDRDTHIRRDKHQKPLYIVITASMVIGTVNGLYFGSEGIFLACLAVGGAALIYLWRIVRD
jgi:hypothetical protein